MGAVDVVPFIPITECTTEECVEYAKEVGKAIGELDIPVYLYEDAATKPERKNLAKVRKGQYEGFFEKIKEDGWEPDFGPREMNVKSCLLYTSIDRVQQVDERKREVIDRVDAQSLHLICTASGPREHNRPKRTGIFQRSREHVTSKTQLIVFISIERSRNTNAQELVAHRGVAEDGCQHGCKEQTRDAVNFLLNTTKETLNNTAAFQRTAESNR